MPCSPMQPGSPFGPASPRTPCGPRGPIGPTGPRGPMGPGQPVSPLMPRGPMGPCSPLPPSGPAAPPAPWGRGNPVWSHRFRTRHSYSRSFRCRNGVVIHIHAPLSFVRFVFTSIRSGGRACTTKLPPGYNNAHTTHSAWCHKKQKIGRHHMMPADFGLSHSWITCSFLRPRECSSRYPPALFPLFRCQGLKYRILSGSSAFSACCSTVSG